MNTKKIVNYAVSVGIILISLALTIASALGAFEFGSHAIWLFVLCMTGGFGIFTLVKAFASKSPFSFMLSSILLLIALSYCLIDLVKLQWWLVVICAVILAVLISLTSIFVAGNKTESIALNDKEGYKDYEQRKAEKAIAEEETTPEELPEIKSFK